MAKREHKHHETEVAEMLLQINAIKLNARNPFRWSSGLLSPIYCDNRQILSYPDLRRLLVVRMADICRREYPGLELIAGVATGAIAIGVLLADALNLPFVYVRSSAKSHGLGLRIEGHFMEGQKTLVVEDLVSTARSSLAAVEAVRSVGLKVEGMLAIFSYGLEVAQNNLKEAGCRLHCLSDFDALLELFSQDQRIGEEEYNVLKDWQRDPIAWSDARKNKE